MPRWLALSGLLALLGAGAADATQLAGVTGATGEARLQRPRPDAAEPGAFCTPTACRPAAASPWTAAAFGATALAIGWRARRRDTPDR